MDVSRRVDMKHRQRKPAKPIANPSRYARWRAGTLLLVYVLMAAHITHWVVTGKTLAPLELNEVMYTFELGIVTAGFVFMAVALLATAIFGRFFCSWGCHILALQDLCAWILEKLHIRPKGVRSRLLLWIPLVTAGYMFVWPQVVRVWEGRPLPTLHLAEDADGWASFATNDFWRNLPSPAVALVTFAVVGFVVVYVLGSRGFCAYGCPYGAVFALADRVAPGRIRVGNDCEQCGTCTAVCSSHIRVHEETARYGMVVNPACMKDLDCVAACPQQTLRYGFGKPSLLPSVAQPEVAVARRYDFSIGEDLIMGVVFIATLVIYRGLYELVPLFLAIAFGVMAAYATIVLIRLTRRDIVAFNRWHLKSKNRLNGRGWTFVAVSAVGILVTAHSVFVRYHLIEGAKYAHRALASPVPASPSSSVASSVPAAAIAHLETANAVGFFTTEQADTLLAELFSRRGDWSGAERYRARLVERFPRSAPVRTALAEALSKQGRSADAFREYQAALDLAPNRAETHFAVAGFYFETGQLSVAAHHLSEAVRLRPNFPEAEMEWGALMIQSGDLGGGIQHLRSAIELHPDFGDAHYNLAVALAMTGRLDDAMVEIERTLRIQPQDERSNAFRAHLVSLGRGQ